MSITSAISEVSYKVHNSERRCNLHEHRNARIWFKYRNEGYNVNL